MGEPVTVTVRLELLQDIAATLEECSQDLRAYLDHEYPAEIRAKYPTLQRRYYRDIDPADRADELLRTLLSEVPVRGDYDAQQDAEG